MNIVERVRKDLLHVYGSDPLYHRFLTAKNADEQKEYKETLIAIRGQYAYNCLVKFFKEKIAIYKHQQETKK